MTAHRENLEADDVDRLEQGAAVDPSDDDTLPEGGPGEADEADWLDQQTEAPQNEDGHNQD